VDLGNGVFLSDSSVPTVPTVATFSVIRLSDRDIDDVYNILSIGSRVTIER
jgi:hypothetical protein